MFTVRHLPFFFTDPNVLFNLKLRNIKEEEKKREENPLIIASIFFFFA